jgi:hypothetical protein
MTVPRTDPDVRAPASLAREESTREKNEGQLSALQVAAGALAAVSAAVIASFFGVAGTVIGAAVASVVSTVGAAVYTESMRRTHAGLRRLVRSPQAPVHRSAGDRPPLPAHLDPRRSPPYRRWARWALVAATAVAVFGLAMVVVTTVELIGHKPVTAPVGGSNQAGGTTLGSLTGGTRRRQPTAAGAGVPRDHPHRRHRARIGLPADPDLRRGLDTEVRRRVEGFLDAHLLSAKQRAEQRAGLTDRAGGAAGAGTARHPSSRAVGVRSFRGWIEGRARTAFVRL